MSDLDMEPARRRSLWLSTFPGRLDPRPALEHDMDVDVAIVGAGFTGLWTAYYLALLDPSLRIAVVERDIAGFGASGRNGGWASAFIAGSAGVYAGRSDTAAVLRAERETIASIDEMARVCVDESIDCGFAHGGTLTVATSEPQRARLQAGVAAKHARGITDADLRLLDARASDDHARVAGTIAASYSPHCARIDPARLVRGLAEACERRNITIFEQSPGEIAPGLVRTPRGSLRSPMVVRATESYSVQAPGWGRRFLPLYSLMIATEPLADDIWAELGWAEGLTVSDAHHLFFYAQRTSDGRIAIGGRGAPYRIGSPIDQSNEHNDAVRQRLEATLRRCFPAIGKASITHHWGGTLAVPRDWCMSITCDRTAGTAWSGGYSGHGVVAAHLGGRTVAELILQRDTARTSLPWVGHRSRNWEPEPLRFLASKAIVSVLGSADRIEDARGRTARRTRLVAPFVMSR